MHPLFVYFRYDQAIEFYKTILEEEPTNYLIMKRKVAVYKAKGDILSAITELTKLLEMYIIIIY